MTLRLAHFLLALPCAALATELRQASVNQIVNDVRVIDPRLGARAAVLKETIKGELGVATGPQSRAELLFQDQTLTRLGAETFFHFKAGTRDLTLDKGTMLLQVPKGLGGARIRTGSVTASITGTTIMLEHLPRKQVRVLVLEGSLQLTNRSGETRELTAGRMLTLDPQGKRMPEPVAVDLRKVVGSSSLIDPRGFKGSSNARPAPLPSLGLIRKEIAQQDVQIRTRGTLANETRPIESAVVTDSSLKTNSTVARAQAATVAETAKSVEVSSNAKPTLAVASLSRSTSEIQAVAKAAVVEADQIAIEKKDAAAEKDSTEKGRSMSWKDYWRHYWEHHHDDRKDRDVDDHKDKEKKGKNG